jgi:hypothetical protein
MEHYYKIKGLRYFSAILKGSFLLYLTGFLSNRSMFLIYLNNVLKIVASCFLIYRFNRFRKPAIVFNQLDRSLIYSIGVYILVISFSEFLLKMTLILRSHIISYKTEIITWVRKIILN